MINHTPPSSYLHMIGIQIPRIIMTQGSRYIVLITGIIVIVAITPMKIMAQKIEQQQEDQYQGEKNNASQTEAPPPLISLIFSGSLTVRSKVYSEAATSYSSIFESKIYYSSYSTSDKAQISKSSNSDSKILISVSDGVGVNVDNLNNKDNKNYSGAIIYYNPLILNLNQ